MTFFFLFRIIINSENNLFIIDENYDNFYIIPKDKQGLKIPYEDKRILENNSNNFDITIKNMQYFSIQLFSSPKK